MHVVRVLFALLVLGSGALLQLLEPGPASLAMIGVGVLVLAAGLLLELRIRRSPPAAREVLTGGAGLLLGLLVGMVAIAALRALPLVAIFTAEQVHAASAAALLFLCLLGYVGLVAGQTAVRAASPPRAPGAPDPSPTQFVLRERALIDGRAVRLAQSALLAGDVVVPRYVVDSLQTLAASRNPVEHFRGERGLENLRILQQTPHRAVRIREIDVSRGEVAGLLAFAQGSDTRILTQNEELLSEAAAHGVQAVDLSRLAELLKPDVVQGDELVVKLVKPGKEREQAVGYLEDGNMVVVENAREEVGRTVRVVVTGVHQTRAGTLIFANRKEAPAP